MDVTLLLVQSLNGLQLGVMLFLLAAGLTLVFGIMNLINLAHGSMYMLGAYLAATFQGWTDSFVLGVILAMPFTFAIGMVVEVVALRTLYNRDHLDQVLATFGLILFFNELVRLIWGPQARFMAVPQALSGQIVLLPGVPLLGLPSGSCRGGAPHRCRALCRDPAHTARHVDSCWRQ